MKAITVVPKQLGSLELSDIPLPHPSKSEVLLKVERVGICGTDRDIISGFYGEAPSGNERLVLGHESLCRVHSLGAGVTEHLKKGDLVVPTVRRPCPENCLNCRNEQSDFCTTGHYREHGIKELDGFASEFALSHSKFVTKLPNSLDKVGILLEPLTIVEKGLIQTYLIQDSRLKWKPSRALVLGAGPVGLLAVAILRLKGLEVDAVATRSEESLKARLVQKTGGNYVSAKKVDLHSLDSKYDIVFEVTGSSAIALEAQDLIRVNGVVCYLGIYRQEEGTSNIGKLFTDMVLGNKVHFGSVNANISYFEVGAKDLLQIKRKWPGFLESLITKIAKPDNPTKAYSPETQEEIKTVIEFK